MASVPRSGSVQPNNSQPESPPTLSWEGERMFNIYIFDYCNKRGFRKTARELMNEADIPPDSSPPINARQGLLFEWWSVFWVLFTAKANGRGPEEAMLYTQHQAQRAAQRLQGPPGPQIHPPGQQPQPPMPQHQAAPSRLPNGMTTAGQRFMPNGPMPNGVGHGPGPGPMPPTGPTAFPMGTSGLQPNGIVGPPGAPPTGAVPGSQPQNFPQMMSGQRPPQHIGGPQPGQQPPQRGGPVFQSPTMPHAPQNPPGPPQQHQQGQPPNQHPPMGQLGMGSPHLNHLNRGMMPPNIPQGLNPMNPNQQGGPGAPSQFQAGRPPSRTATPGQGQAPTQGGMMHLSPSIAARQPPGVGPGGTPLIRQDQLMNEFMSIPQNAMQQMKQDLGLGDKDISLLSPNEKHRIVTMYRSRFARKSGPENMVAGPSNPMMQPPNVHQRNPQQQQQPPPPQQQQQQVQQQRNKRNSTSPGQEHDTIPRNDASPPDRKRLRRSPLEQPAVPPYAITTQTPAQPGQPPQMGGSQPMMVGIQPGQGMPPGQGMMVRPPVIGPPGVGLNTGVPSGPQHAGQPPMGTPMMNIGGQPMGMVMNSHMQLQREQFRAQQPAAAMGAKPGMPHPGVPMPGVPGNAGSPPSTDPSTFNIGGPGQGPTFNPAAVGPANRIGGPQNKMMPPPSPAVNGPPKDQSSAAPPGAAGPGRPDTKTQAGGATNPDGSPRNQALPNAGTNAGQTPNQPNTAPPTPGPGPSQPPQPGQQGASGPTQTPGTTQPPNLQSMAPSPSSILGGPSGMTGQSLMPDPMSGNIFSTDFIQSVASSLDDFDPTLFRPDGDINFERDFGQWFNPDDVTGPLDAMK